MRPGPDDTKVERTVLELRIHGVNNTSPHSMLDLHDYQVEQIGGDKLGSFWQAKPHLLAAIEPGQPGHTPPGVRREAYSWGGMARSSPGARGTGVRSTVANALGRFGWALLLPFGLANVAYWTRRLPDRGSATPHWWSGNGAASVRVFGLGLTVLLVITTCEVALDLVGAQCYAGGQDRCTALPGIFDVLVGKVIALRVLIASVIPVALLLGLWLLAVRSRARYEQREPSTAGDPQSRRMLAAPDFWRGEAMVRGLVPLHLTAGFAVIVLATSWPAVFGTGTGLACRGPFDLLEAACWTQVRSAPAADEWIFGGITGVALGLLVAAVVLVCLHTKDAPDLEGAVRGSTTATRVVLGLAIALLAVHAVAMWWRRPAIAHAVLAPQADGGVAEQALSLPGINGAPTIVVAALAGLALPALAWRASTWRWAAGALGVVFAVGLLAAAAQPLFVLVSLVAAIAILVLAGRQGPEERRYTAWSGMAPGVILNVALLTAMTLSTLVVLTVGQLLNGENSAPDLVSCFDRGGPGQPDLCVPAAYVWFGAGFALAAAAVAVLLLLLCLATAYYWLRGFNVPRASGPVASKVRRMRHLAALAHRAEKVAGAAAAFGLLAAALTVFGSAAGPSPWQSNEWLTTVGSGLTNGGVWVTALVGTSSAAAVAGGGLLGGRRPLGLVWDLICFLPRAAHPFGPPCYAERAVPEITDRCRDWLDGNDGHPDARVRTVVLSAHSLGAVLAVAVLFALPANLVHRMALLTYGTQLRAYFGRIFPELLGRAVLGTPGCAAAQLRGVDPWTDDERITSPPDPANADNLRARLTRGETIRWRSLWRRTDYLGFPVYGFEQATDNPIDRLATEQAPGADPDRAVYTHSEYPQTHQYREMLAILMRRPPWRPPQQPSRAAASTSQ